MNANSVLINMAIAVAVKEVNRPDFPKSNDYFKELVQTFKDCYRTLEENHLKEMEHYLRIFDADGL